MNREQLELVRQLRRRLQDRSFLADDPRAYREGVDDALSGIEAAIEPPDTIDITDRANDAATRYLAVT